LYVEGDHLRAKGTTLGADDGMGCAYMLAILDDKTLNHPYLECCFTTQEEVGLVGALALKPEYFTARQMINLDGAGEYKTYMSMGGGKTITVNKEIEFVPVDEPTFQLNITGLLGGHSGGMIDKERANANKLAARVMYHLELKGIQFHLIKINGGSKNNVITSASEVLFTSKEDFRKINDIVDMCARDIHTEFEFSDPDISISLKMLDTRITKVMPEKLSMEVIELLYLLPFGQKARSVVMENLPIASINLGVVATFENRIEIVESMRSAVDSWFGELENQVILLAKHYGATWKISPGYPGWRYEKYSPLREKMCVVFQEIYNKPLACLGGHGGNECGVFKKLFPDMDIVTSGAIYGLIHTTDEFLDLASFDRAYKLLTYFLSKI
jgi:dipeptidase D